MRNMIRLTIVPFFVFFMAITAFAQEAPQVVTDISQAFIKGAIVVRGESTAEARFSPAQKRLMALRGAKTVAMREIAEIINGVAVSGDTTVENMSAKSDNVRATVSGMVRGAQVMKEEYDPLTETAVVYLVIPMTGVNGILSSLLPQIMPYNPAAPAFQPQSAAANAKVYDGLIIDVRSEPFKPALINRVVTRNGDVVYEPSKVDSGVLVERGAAEYTNDIGKARALLSERGANNPLVIKASAMVKLTDVEVTAEDASAIFASNQANNYIRVARVVFVLK